jgi:hypothetical protein
MKELDYLWDKQGTDTDIEALESALRSFAYSETAPPKIADAPAIAKSWSFLDLFQFRFALAGLCVAVTCLGLVWLVVRKNDTPDISYIDRTEQTAAPIAPTPDCPTCGSPHGSNGEMLDPVQKPARSKGDMLNTENELKNIDQFANPVNTPPNGTVIQAAHTNGPKKKKKKNVRMIYRPVRPLPEVMTAVAVTKEEADAYNKLMLALSITSSKLKIVKEKVDGSSDRGLR